MTGSADFWSRRKARVAAEDAAEARAAEAEAAAASEAALAEKSDEEVCEELGLPDPDTLGPGDDFRAFMAQSVPDRLRRRALRRLWVSNPVLANLDGLIDYGQDFTDSACVVENLQTTYQVGKGMLAHVKEMARQAELEQAELEQAELEAEQEVTPEGEPAPVAMSAPSVEPEEAAEPAPEPQKVVHVSAEAAIAEPEEHPLPPRRRMSFAFAGADGVHS